jgi:xanthine dehydrogenase molybdenum-binding subunit
VAEEMKVPLQQVRILMGDTDAGAFSIDIGFGGSRSTNIGGHVVIEACRDLRAKLADHAAQILGCPADQVAYDGGSFHTTTDRRKALSLGEIVARVDGGRPVTVTTKTEVPMQRSSTSFVAQVAEVEVDPETGQVKLRRFVTAHDVGTIINTIAHQGQIDGGVVMAIGAALMEEMPLDDGKITAGNLGEYKLPCIVDIPDLETVLVRSPKGPGPYEAKAIGEMANVSPPAAIANAVADAVGVRLFELPITSEKIYRALKEGAS